MSKLEKYLRTQGMQFKKDHNIPMNSYVFVELLKDGKVLDEYLGSTSNIYCREAGKIADAIAVYKYFDHGRNGWGYLRDTKRVVTFPSMPAKI